MTQTPDFKQSTSILNHFKVDTGFKLFKNGEKVLIFVYNYFIVNILVIGGIKLIIGSHVLFQGREYVIIHKYTSGYCEIKDLNRLYHIELVHLTELKIQQ